MWHASTSGSALLKTHMHTALIACSAVLHQAQAKQKEVLEIMCNITEAVVSNVDLVDLFGCACIASEWVRY